MKTGQGENLTLFFRAWEWCKASCGVTEWLDFIKRFGSGCGHSLPAQIDDGVSEMSVTVGGLNSRKKKSG